MIFAILYKLGLRSKMEPYSTVWGIPPAQTFGAHIFRVFLILTNIDSNFEILVSYRLISVRQKHDIFQNSSIYSNNDKDYVEHLCYGGGKVDCMILASISSLSCF